MRPSDTWERRFSGVMRYARVAASVTALLLLGTAAAAEAQAIPADTLPSRELRGLLQAVDAFVQRADRLEKGGKIAKADVEALEADAEAVRRAIPGARAAVASAVGKLQASGKWTADFDAFAETRLRERRADDALGYLRKRGGARAALQATARLVDDLKRSVDTDVADLRGKTVAERLLDELFGTPVHAYSRVTYCQLYLNAKAWCYLGVDTMSTCTDAILYGGACRGEY